MAQKQEPRPAYHRRNDLQRLQYLASSLPVVVVDAGHHYEVQLPDGTRLMRGRYEVIWAYLTGWLHARGRLDG
jgi:hypothetical protein